MAEADTYTMTPQQPDPGARLRHAREQAGVERAEISAWTKINERHLTALEAGDYASMPPRPYVIGFARAYAHSVGLDAEEIAGAVRDEYDRRNSVEPMRPSHFSEIEDPAKVPSRRLVWLAAAALVVLIVGLMLLWRSYLDPAAELPAVTADTTLTPPELSPAAQVSPTAESAVGAAAARQAPAPASAVPAGTGPAPSPTPSASPAPAP